LCGEIPKDDTSTSGEIPKDDGQYRPAGPAKVTVSEHLPKQKPQKDCFATTTPKSKLMQSMSRFPHEEFMALRAGGFIIFIMIIFDVHFRHFLHLDLFVVVGVQRPRIPKMK